MRRTSTCCETASRRRLKRKGLVVSTSWLPQVRPDLGRAGPCAFASSRLLAWGRRYRPDPVRTGGLANHRPVAAAATRHPRSRRRGLRLRWLVMSAITAARTRACRSGETVGQLEGRMVVVSGSDDRTVRVWDAATGGPVGEPFTPHIVRHAPGVATLRTHDGRIWSPTGRRRLKPQVRGLLAWERRCPVKPSAQPTMVRIHHPPPPSRSGRKPRSDRMSVSSGTGRLTGRRSRW